MQFRFVAAGSAVLCSAVCLAEQQVDQIGTYSGWSGLTWHAMGGTNDGQETASPGSRLDFVGDSSNAGGYWSTNDAYVFFRMRVAVDDIPAKTTYTDTLQVVIDLKGVGTTNVPDYAFAWDAKSASTAHGLEMQKVAPGSTNAATWGAVSMDDWDGSDGQKTADDINGGNRATDGFVRTVGGQSNFANTPTSFVDVAVSWSYLSSQSTAGLKLSKDNLANWRIAFSSIADATDHNVLGKNGDISGGVSSSASLSTGWADIDDLTLSLTSVGTPAATKEAAIPGTSDYGKLGTMNGDVVVSLTGLTSASFTTPGIYTWIIANVTSWSPSSVTYTNSWGASASQFNVFTVNGAGSTKDVYVSFTYSAVPEATTLLLGFAGLAPVLLQRQGRGRRTAAAAVA